MSRIREIRKARGMTLKQLADKIGVTEVSASRYEKEDQRLTLPLMAKIAVALDCDPADLLATPGAAPEKPVKGEAGLAPRDEVDLTTIQPLPALTSMVRDLPVIGTAVGGNGGDFQLNGSTVDYARRPPALAGLKEAFAIYLRGDSMEPRYEDGDLLYVHPGRPATPGRDVLIELHGEHGEPGSCFVKRLVRRTAIALVLRQYNPENEFEIPLDQVRVVYPILKQSELMGV